MDYSKYKCKWTGLPCIACSAGACEFRNLGDKNETSKKETTKKSYPNARKQD